MAALISAITKQDGPTPGPVAWPSHRGWPRLALIAAAWPSFVARAWRGRRRTSLTQPERGSSAWAGTAAWTGALVSRSAEVSIPARHTERDTILVGSARCR